MNSINIDASEKQLSKLRNGHKVRIKSGQGFNLIVKPGNFNLASKAFNKQKGVEIMLSPDEIMANVQNSKMNGNGIFGKRFDKFLEKRGIKKSVYALGDLLKTPIKRGIDYASTYAPQLGAQAMSGIAAALGQQEYAPYASALGERLGSYAGDKVASKAKNYLDNPEGRGFVSNVGGPNNSMAKARNLMEQVQNNRELEALNLMSGTNYGYMGRAGIANYLKNASTASNIRNSVKEAKIGQGMMAGMGRRNLSILAEDLSLRKRNMGLMGASNQSVLPQAMQSQPYSENFQFQFTLPPQYQRKR